MEEAVEESVPVLGQCGLGMKLDADDGMLAVLEGHDLTVIGGGGDAEDRGKRGG